MKHKLTSGFVRKDFEDEAFISDNDFTDITTLSLREHSHLYKARRRGQLWVLKGLREEEREIPFYQNLLKKEYDILTKLQHPSIVHVYEWREIKDLGPCIVMEYIDGKALDEMLDGSRQARRKMAFEIAGIVEYIHHMQIVHRDLKPENILVTHNGRHIKIIDFGLADTDSHIILKQPAGTDGYMSPEQETLPHPDVRNDIYSLGCIFGEMKLGWIYERLIQRMKKPIDKRPASMQEVLKSMNDARLKPLRIAASFFSVVILGAAAMAFSIQQPATPETAEVPKIVKDTVVVHTRQIVKQTPVDTHIQTVERIKTKGKKMIDDYFRAVNFTALIDTFDINGTSFVDYGKIQQEATRRLLDYVDKQKNTLNEDELIALNIYLTTQINKHTAPIRKKLDQQCSKS